MTTHIIPLIKFVPFFPKGSKKQEQTQTQSNYLRHKVINKQGKQKKLPKVINNQRGICSVRQVSHTRMKKEKSYFLLLARRSEVKASSFAIIKSHFIPAHPTNLLSTLVYFLQNYSRGCGT
jgi:hypothetical protein